MDQCVLLNADYTFLNVVNWKRAMCLIAKGKVQVLRHSERLIRTAEGLAVKVPAVLRLIKLIRTLYINRVPFSKKNVLIRDGFKCAYCGGVKRKLTIDHIIPKSKGGRTQWDNLVACSKNINRMKSNKTPTEARLKLLKKPVKPQYHNLFLDPKKKYPESWDKFFILNK